MKINEIITEGSMEDQMSMIKRKLADKSANELSTGLSKALDNSRKSGANVTYKGGKLSQPATQQTAPVSAQPVKAEPKARLLPKNTPVDQPDNKKYSNADLDRLMGYWKRLKKESADLKNYIITKAIENNVYLDNTEKRGLEPPLTKDQELSILYDGSIPQSQRYKQLIGMYNNHNKTLMSYIKTRNMR
jgi:hypothetical protein